MERPHQIADRRAIERFETCWKNRQDPVQLLLPAIEIAAAMRAGVGELIRRAGLELIRLLTEQEVEGVVGKRHQPSQTRQAYRWGKDAGWCRIYGQKVPLERPRARQVDGSELRRHAAGWARTPPGQPGSWRRPIAVFADETDPVLIDFHRRSSLGKGAADKARLRCENEELILSGKKNKKFSPDELLRLKAFGIREPDPEASIEEMTHLLVTLALREMERIGAQPIPMRS